MNGKLLKNRITRLLYKPSKKKEPILSRVSNTLTQMDRFLEVQTKSIKTKTKESKKKK